MNDEPSSSAIPLTSSHHEDHEEAIPTAAELAERRKANRQMFNKKRGELLDDLLRNLDILVYAELSAIYYMDTSFLRLLLRCLVQFMFLTPKPPLFPEHPADRPIIGALVGSNLLCILLHLYLTPPSAGEATRGYLHGGLAMDFIGQKGPSSRVHLLVLDLLVVGLQLVHMVATGVRKRLKEAAASASTVAAQATTASAPVPTSAQQDLDSEERGVRRSGEQQDIEMQTLNPSGTATTQDPTAIDPLPSPDDTAPLLSNTNLQPRSDAHIFSAFHSGQIIVADLNIWKGAQEQVQLVKKAAVQQQGQSSSVQASAAGIGLRAELARRVLRMRDGADALRGGLR